MFCGVCTTPDGQWISTKSALASYNFNPRANAIAIALGAPQSDFQPMVGVRAAVHPDFSLLAQRGHDYIDAAVAIEQKSASACRFDVHMTHVYRTISAVHVPIPRHGMSSTRKTKESTSPGVSGREEFSFCLMLKSQFYETRYPKWAGTRI
jgi:hypothetical protein